MITFKQSELDRLDDSNGIERGKEQQTLKQIKSMQILIDEVDLRDGTFGEDIKVNQLRNLANNCLEIENYKLGHNWKQQHILDSKFMGHKKNRPPLKAA